MHTQTLEFRSDNCGRVAPEIIEAISRANHGSAIGYGADDLTLQLNMRVSEIFETQVRVFPIPTGTGANALALASVGTPFGAVFCSPEAHINTSECNAVGFFGSGLKVTPIDGIHGKVCPDSLEKNLHSAGFGQAHKSQPVAVNLVQATYLGAVYSVAEIQRISALAREKNLTVHMDGARFANALAYLGCTPAEMTWKSGVDILSLGVTKNGGLLSDAIVVFNPAVADKINFHLRRGGMIWSKMRFASAQILAYVENDLWLRLAKQSNLAAQQLAAGINNIPGARLIAPVQANELFAEMRAQSLDQLAQHGVLFYRRGPELARFVCRWETTEEEVQSLLSLIAQHA
ncbi:threonine aldolase family protein [Zwartia panacis]|uniref:threonine aldolase family protein n=1 Tax=Zwartia panacis TaxID=2683345 RepID=UPI0025B52BAC|nr:beta-eliminating lyase-related protein [Zwartia panacis]MDN4016764.1 beta-eliminating lyase-related protein [Zwartia panacis]